LEEIKAEFAKEMGEAIKLDKQGIIVKADSLGSLEALITLLRQEMNGYSEHQVQIVL